MVEPRPGSPAQALLALRIIGASLGVGVTLFAAVSWVVHQGRAPSPPPIDHDLAVNLLIGVAALAIVAAILFWRARVASLIQRRPAPSTEPGQVQSNVIICWALVEAPAMLAVAVYFLYGDVVAGIAGVALIWIGLGLTWPRPAWLADG